MEKGIFRSTVSVMLIQLFYFLATAAQIVFVVLKITGSVLWKWHPFVLLPFYLMVGVTVLIFIFAIILLNIANKQMIEKKKTDKKSVFNI